MHVELTFKNLPDHLLKEFVHTETNVAQYLAGKLSGQFTALQIKNGFSCKFNQTASGTPTDLTLWMPIAHQAAQSFEKDQICDALNIPTTCLIGITVGRKPA